MKADLNIQIKEKEKALLIGTLKPSEQRWDREDLMHELERLTETAGALVIDSLIQSIRQPDPAYFIGKGKTDELVRLCDQYQIDIIIFNDNLTPVQQKNLETKLERKTIDRTGLILDIFAQRAFSREGKLQVELAQLQYMLPRLTRMWTHLSRLGGGIGTRGPGETQLETDKRRLRTRISRIKKELKNISKHRLQHRLSRQGVPLPVVALVGYTNSGKSTLFKQLTGAETLIEDKLFATLDPLVRRIDLSNRQDILLLDTVGFIRELPTQLIASFKSTLEEINSADLILHVIDITHPMRDQHIETVQTILDDLLTNTTPQVVVFNKIDLSPTGEKLLFNKSYPDVCYISALQNQGMNFLKDAILQKIKAFRKLLTLSIPYNNNKIIRFIHRYGTIIKADYFEGNMQLTAEFDLVKAQKLTHMVEQSSCSILSSPVE